MSDFIKRVDAASEFPNVTLGDDELHRRSRDAAFLLTSLLTIHREPYLLAGELPDQNG